MSRLTPQSVSEWGSVVPMLMGTVGLTACFLIWALTPDHIYQAGFVTTFAGLLAAGAGFKAIDAFRNPPTPPVPPLDPPPELQAVEAGESS